MASRPALRRALAVTAALVIIAVDIMLRRHLPTLATVVAPFDTAGTAGTVTVGPTFAVTVEDVEIAPTVLDASMYRAKPVPALGRWVAVRVAASASIGTLSYYPDLKIGANTYAPAPQFPSQFSVKHLNPSFVKTGLLIFDVPTDLVEPAVTKSFQLQLTPSLLFADRLVIDLGTVMANRSDRIEFSDVIETAQQ